MKAAKQGKVSRTDSPLRIAILTMDTHLAVATQTVQQELVEQHPELGLELHAASEWAADGDKLSRCREAIAQADIIVVTMLFLEDHFKPILDDLAARRDNCDALVCAMSASEVVKLTRMGGLDMGKPATGLTAFLKRLRGKKQGAQAGGKAQMKVLRQLPKLLRLIPGTAQDLRAYFLTLQYWLSGSQENIRNLAMFLASRYASGPHRALRQRLKADPPVEYPEVGVYHPRMQGRFAANSDALPTLSASTRQGRVGVLLLRSYLLSGNARHYDGVIGALEARGLEVVPAFASGLDARPAVERFFMRDGAATVDAVVSLTGFSLVGGPAYNNAKAAEDTLAALDVPYLAAHPVEFQTLDQWGASGRGLMPVESTIMVAIPELDGATNPIIFGGRAGACGTHCDGCDRHCEFAAGSNTHDMQSCPERAHMLANRVAKLVSLRATARRERKIALVLFNFPPNAGNIGTAAYLSVFESVYNLLVRMRDEGYDVEVPEDVDALREAVLAGNAERFGADANVHTLIPTEDHVRDERWLEQIEAQWGAAPGKQLTNGSSIFVLGKSFGNVLVAVQPAFGYEGDPMRLLFEGGLAPTHAFSAFYRYLREGFAADAVLHFGTHGALEFMPGKQSGMSAACWPDRLIQDLPNLYLYASNNPSEGAIAKRRAGASLISYLTPPIARAGLYRELIDLKAAIDQWRGLETTSGEEQADLLGLIQSLAVQLELARAEPAWTVGDDGDAQVHSLSESLLELEHTLIPHGLHVVGKSLSKTEREDMVQAMADTAFERDVSPEAVAELVADGNPKAVLAAAGVDHDAQSEAHVKELASAAHLLEEETELDALVNALDGRFIRPAPGGDLLRTPGVLPTGRNLHGFDPFAIPTAFALRDGARQADRLLQRCRDDSGRLPESVALVLWGTDNLKSGGGPIGQVLALLGARARLDSFGRVAGAELIPLSELGRPRIDAVVTISGIFRDLLPLQIRLLAEAAALAAAADEPVEDNYVRKHALAYQAEHGCSLEEASLRVFGNEEGAYGANVNNLVESSNWDDEDEIAETFSRRKGFAYGPTGRAESRGDLMRSALADVDATYQNLESVELGVTTVDNYFDNLGGITGAVKRAKGGDTPPVYIGDQTRGDGGVRSLAEQVAIETRTRALNPKWYEGMLEHGYEGVRQIEVHMTNTMGWSATTGQVQPWVYQKLTETFLLDPQMRERLSALNPTASSRVANRMMEAYERDYWSPDDKTLAALRDACDELEDRLEGVLPPSTDSAVA